jgi:hypothetical protein
VRTPLAPLSPSFPNQYQSPVGPALPCNPAAQSPLQHLPVFPGSTPAAQSPLQHLPVFPGSTPAAQSAFQRPVHSPASTLLLHVQVPAAFLKQHSRQWKCIFEAIWKTPKVSFVTAHCLDPRTLTDNRPKSQDAKTNRSRNNYVESLLLTCETDVINWISLQTGMDKLMVKPAVVELHKENQDKAMNFLKNRMREFKAAVIAYYDTHLGQMTDLWETWVFLEKKPVAHAFRLKDVSELRLEHMKSFVYRLMVHLHFDVLSPAHQYVVSGRRFPDGTHIT